MSIFVKNMLMSLIAINEEMIDSGLAMVKSLLIDKEYYLALQELKYIVELLEEIVKIDKEYPYAEKLQVFAQFKKSAMEGLLREA